MTYEVDMCEVFPTLYKQFVTSVITIFPNESRSFAPIGYSVSYDIKFAQVMCVLIESRCVPLDLHDIFSASAYLFSAEW